MKALLILAGVIVIFSMNLATAAADGTVPVPEPISLGMVGLGVAGLAAFKLYKKSK